MQFLSCLAGVRLTKTSISCGRSCPLTGEDLAGLPYAERLARLLAHGFGLWDVLGACERKGSLDSNIRNAAANDFMRLRELCPALETVGFNGQTSGRFAAQFAAAGYRTHVLPSRSRRNISVVASR